MRGYNFSVHTCPTCRTTSNGILCLRCLEADIQRDRVAREKGADARDAGQPIEANPYIEAGNRDAWVWGWRHGHRPASVA